MLRRGGDDHVGGARAEAVHRLVGQLVHVLHRPVVPEAGGIVEHALELGVGDRGDHLAVRLELEQRGDQLAQLRLATRIGREQSHRERPLQRLGHELLGRSGDVQDPSAELVRRAVLDQVAVAPHNLGTALRAEQHQRDRELGELGEAEGELGRDPEVAAAAVQRPEQLGVLLLACGHGATVRGRQLDREQVVACEPELALEPPGAAAQSETGHSGGRDAAAGRGQAMRLRCLVDVAPGRSPADRGGAGAWIHLYRVHFAHVDHQAALGQACARDAVAAAADRDLEPALAPERDRGRHVVRAGTLGDHRGPALDHRVEDRPRVFISRIGGLQHCPAMSLAQPPGHAVAQLDSTHLNPPSSACACAPCGAVGGYCVDDASASTLSCSSDRRSERAIWGRMKKTSVSRVNTPASRTR